jgi:hypothetical protein
VRLHSQIETQYMTVQSFMSVIACRARMRIALDSELMPRSYGADSASRSGNEP